MTPRIFETVTTRVEGTGWVQVRCACASHRRDLTAWEDPEAALDELHALHRRECPTCPHHYRVRQTHGAAAPRPRVIARSGGVLRARCATCGDVRALDDLVGIDVGQERRRWYCEPCAAALRPSLEVPS